MHNKSNESIRQEHFINFDTFYHKMLDKIIL